MGTMNRPKISGKVFPTLAVVTTTTSTPNTTTSWPAPSAGMAADPSSAGAGPMSQDPGPPAPTDFIAGLWKLVCAGGAVEWTSSGKEFVVKDAGRLERDSAGIIGKSIKWPTFVRNLNFYRFTHVSETNVGTGLVECTFKHPLFCRDGEALLPQIRRGGRGGRSRAPATKRIRDEVVGSGAPKKLSKRAKMIAPEMPPSTVTLTESSSTSLREPQSSETGSSALTGSELASSTSSSSSGGGRFKAMIPTFDKRKKLNFAEKMLLAQQFRTTKSKTGNVVKRLKKIETLLSSIRREMSGQNAAINWLTTKLVDLTNREPPTAHGNGNSHHREA